MAYLIAIEMMRVQLMVYEMKSNSLNPIINGEELLDPDDLWGEEMPRSDRLISQIVSKTAKGKSSTDSTMELLI